MCYIGEDDALSKPTTPKSILFVCNMNQIRSPMAEFLTKDVFGTSIYAQSAGIYKGDEDGFMQAVMQERGIDVSTHEPATLNELEDHFVDLVVTLTEQANDFTRDFFRDEAVDIEFWPVENPSIAVGRREEVLATYRKTREDLESRIRERFSK
ncbi:MAG: low molecular weight phosphatase family protein [Pseudomonadota bacterium]